MGDCACLYRRQFCGAFSTESTVHFDVWDYDTLDGNDHIGEVSIPLSQTNGPVRLQLSGDKCSSRSEIVVEIARLPLPEANCRLMEAWRVHVKSCMQLPCMDCFSQSDPLVFVTIKGPGSNISPQAFTKVVWNDNSPVFDAHLDFACTSPQFVPALFNQISNAFGEHIDPTIFADGNFNKFLGSMACFRRLQNDGGLSENGGFSSSFWSSEASE